MLFLCFAIQMLHLTELLHCVPFQMKNIASRLCNFAATGNVVELVRMLQTVPSPNLTDYDGRCALHLASAERQAEAVNVLLRAGANA